MKNEKISVVKVCIEDFGTIHMRLNRHYDQGHIQRLTDYITYAMERWQTEVMKIEKIKKYEPDNNNRQ